MTAIDSVELDQQAAVPSRARSGLRLEATRYVVASLAALTFDAGLLWFATQQLRLSSWLAGALAYGSGLVLVYVLSIHWVFSCRTVGDTKREFVIFALLGVIGLVLNSLTLYAAAGVGVALPFAKVMSAGVSFIANFACRKILLFTRSPLSRAT